MGGGGAPDPDPNMGIAARMSAETGQQYLDYMMKQGAVADAWAAEDRDRYMTTFRPLEDQFVAENSNFDTPGRRLSRGNQAEADVVTASGMARDANQRRMTAMGVRPDSGRSIAVGAAANINEGLARAGSRNVASRQVEAEGSQRLASVVQLGQGMAVNPGTSLGMSAQITGQGFGGAMQGYGQQSSILGQQHSQQMQAWQANQASSNSVWGGLGSLAGLFLTSSSKLKTDIRAPERSSLDQVNAMPVRDWRYREGVEDNGAEAHIGPMAEDFQAATGRGDGRRINVTDLLGTTMGAVQELSAKVEAMARSISPAARGAGMGAAAQ